MATVDLNRILASLNQTGFSRKEPAAYQAIQSLIRAVQQSQAEIVVITGGTGGGGGGGAFASKTATYLTSTDQVADLPNSRELLAGSGISFDDSVSGERTINGSGSGSFVPMTTGAYPFEIMGIGQSVMVIHYTGT